MSINKVILVGNLGADPELRYTQNKTAVCSFSLATEYTKRGPEGEIEKETLWHNISCFGPIAEAAGMHLKKGRQAYVEGSLVPNAWDGPDGTVHKGVRVNAHTVEFLGGGVKPAGKE